MKTNVEQFYSCPPIFRRKRKILVHFTAPIILVQAITFVYTTSVSLWSILEHSLSCSQLAFFEFVMYSRTEQSHFG